MALDSTSHEHNTRQGLWPDSCFFKYACVMQRYVTLRCITLRSGDSPGRQQHFLYCGPCHHGAFVCTGATGAVEGARRSHLRNAATSCKNCGGCLSAVTRTKRESLLSAQARQVPRSSPSTCPESEARHASGQQPGATSSPHPVHQRRKADLCALQSWHGLGRLLGIADVTAVYLTG